MADSRKSNVSFGTALVVIALFCLGVWALLPRLVGGGPAKLTMIVSNLRHLDLAKEFWASDHKTNGAVQPTKQDLQPYLGRSNDFLRPVDDEQYVINPVGYPSEALLTRQFGTLPKGTIIRIGSNGVERIMPELAVPQTGASRSVAQTNGQSSETGSRR